MKSDKKYKYDDLIQEVLGPFFDERVITEDVYYHFGRWKNNKWKTWYAIPTQKLLDLTLHRMCDNQIGSLRYLPKIEGKQDAAIIVTDTRMIAQVILYLEDVKDEFEGL